jgi:hypothetical protein
VRQYLEREEEEGCRPPMYEEGCGPPLYDRRWKLTLHAPGSKTIPQTAED